MIAGVTTPFVPGSIQEGNLMAGDRRQTFVKRQKEQRRLAKAAKKRELREARKQAKAEGAPDPDIVDLETLLYGDEGTSEEEAAEAESEATEDKGKPGTAG
jgi:hypothetical protein